MSEELITIDLSEWPVHASLDSSSVGNVVSSIIKAASSSGFFYVSNHGISQSDVDEMFSLSKEFFSLPNSKKESQPIAGNVGYSSIGQERLSEDFEFDFKEAFNLPPFVSQLKEELPAKFEQKRDLLDSFTKDCHSLCKRVLQLLAVSLELNLDYFDESHVYGHPTGSIMRLLHYPPVPEDINATKVIRAGSHSDYGTLTLLFQESNSSNSTPHSGLQILKNNPNGSNQWVDIPSKSGCIVVNIADLLSIWTEGKFKSALHQVVLPNDILSKKSRYSMAYFLHPNSDYPIYSVNTKKEEQGLSGAEGKVTNIGPSVFTYGETDSIYLKRRLNQTYETMG